jgi:hypothetical protein
MASATVMWSGWTPARGSFGSGGQSGEGAGLSEGAAIGGEKLTELVAPDRGTAFLLRAADPGGLLPCPELVTRASIGADHDAALELVTKGSTPQFEGPGSDELEVVVVGVDVENAHGWSG